MTDFAEMVSERIKKLSDEQLERLFSSMRDDNEVFDSIIQSLPIGLVITDRKWRIYKVNKAARRYLHFHGGSYAASASDKQTRGRTVWDAVSDSEVADFIAQCARDQNTNTGREFSVVSADDRARFVEVSVLPLVRKSEIRGTIIFIEDTTAKRQQEILTWRMESLKSITNLAASVAHEIKNPLGAISIHIQLLQRAIRKSRESDNMLPDEEHLEKYIDVVNEEIENLNRIVVDFLVASRPLKPNMTLCAPSNIISKEVEFFTPDFNEAGIEISVKLSDKDSRLLIDEKLFREVLVNIFQNAKSAIQSANREKGLLAVNAFVKGVNYILTIADNGCGMTDEECSRIFEPYYTTKADGTGLGLATVYKIIKDFQGEITVTSEPGKGSIFTIQLPIPQSEVKLLESHEYKEIAADLGQSTEGK